MQICTAKCERMRMDVCLNFLLHILVITPEYFNRIINLSVTYSKFQKVTKKLSKWLKMFLLQFLLVCKGSFIVVL